MAYRSSDGGKTWAFVSGLTHWTQLAFDVNIPGMIHAANGQQPGTAVTRSTDEGLTWSTLFSDYPHTLKSVVVEPGAPSAIDVAGTWAYRSADGGAQWAPMNDPQALGLDLLSVDPRSGRVFGAGHDGNGIRGIDTWRDTTRWKLVAGSPQVLIRTLVVEPGTSTLYAGSISGLYRYHP